MPRFDPPEADWTDDYAWTRYRGPKPYPCPADWVLNLPEEGGAMWYRYPDVGNGLETDDDVFDVFEPDYDDYNDARGEAAFLTPTELDSDRRAQTVTLEWELSIGGDTIFRRVEPDDTDLWATVAEALARYSNDQSLADVAPSSGRLPADIRDQQQIEQRRDENQSLGQFTEREANE